MHFPSYVYTYSEPDCPSPGDEPSGGGSTGEGLEVLLSVGVGVGSSGGGLGRVGEGLSLPVGDALGVGVVDAVELWTSGLRLGHDGGPVMPAGDGTREGTGDCDSGTAAGAWSLVFL